MKTHILTGSKKDIADSILRLEGEIRDVIVFIDEAANSKPQEAEGDIFAEMEPYTVKVASFDDSREAIYTRQEGE